MAGITLLYGVGRYGVNVYGDVGGSGVQPTPTPIEPCLSEQPGYCPTYTRFQFSGVNLGLYIFELNPTNYDIYPQRTTKSYSHTLGHDTTIDQNYDKIEISISWREMSESMWQSIIPYSRKLVDGTSEDLYFWDANLGRFCGRRVKLEEFSAQLVGGNNPIKRFNVNAKLRSV